MVAKTELIFFIGALSDQIHCESFCAFEFADIGLTGVHFGARVWGRRNVVGCLIH